MAFATGWILDTLGSELRAVHGRGPDSFRRFRRRGMTLRRGDLLVAGAGDDPGNALVSGASGCIASRPPRGPVGDGQAVLEVRDGLRSFRRLMAVWRRGFQIPVVAVAGSMGKTTTKELLASCLAGGLSRVHKTEANQNGFWGTALTLSGLDEGVGAAVVEIGIDELGAMSQHLELVRPTAAVLTAVAPEHLSTLGDLDAVTREKRLALRWTHQRGGIVAVNWNDPRIRPLAEELAGPRTVVFAMDPSLEPSDRALQGILRDGALELRGLGQSGARLPCSLPGEHNARNLLAAAALALEMGISAAQMRRGLAGFRGQPGRCEVLEIPGTCRVLADHFNANPVTFDVAFRLIAELRENHPPRGRIWACLGDMLNQGREEVAAHRRLAGRIIEIGAERVLLYGFRMRHLHAALKEDPAFTGEVHHFSNTGVIARFLRDRVRPEDWVLLKGSLRMEMVKVLQALQGIEITPRPPPAF